MKRNGLIVLLVACVAVAGVLATGCGGSSGSQSSASASGKSPACLPATLNHNAKLEGAPVDVSPAPETDTANPAYADQLPWCAGRRDPRGLRRGSAQRPHSGRLRSYSQGDGASFAPDAPFQHGERVCGRAP